jgi:hypothetical protein
MHNGLTESTLAEVCSLVMLVQKLAEGKWCTHQESNLEPSDS